MVSKKFVVRHAGGMDANYVAQLVRMSNQYDCDVYVEFGQKRADGKSIMNMLALGARNGDGIVIIANGPDEEYVLNALEEYLDRQ